MASQRIVLTAPWKLGLFVFLLVVGCGFGLVYAYLRYFGGSLEFDGEQQLNAFYIVCGSVAGLGLLGYLAVVTSSRPLENVIRGGKTREKLLKKFASVNDPRAVDPDEFRLEPSYAKILERWAEDAESASAAQISAQQSREALNSLANQLSKPDFDPAHLDVEACNEELKSLMAAIASIQPASNDAAPGREAGPISNGNHDFDPEIAEETWRGADMDLRDRHEQLVGFARSVAESSEQLHGRVHTQMAGDGVTDTGSSNFELIAERGAQRLVDLRENLETLAEESNRLAIHAALQVSRLGDDGAELMGVTEEIRSLSTRYQRLASDMRLCENDNEMIRSEWSKFAAGDSQQGGGDDSLETLAMVLDQNSGGLQEIAQDLGDWLDRLAEAFGVNLPENARANTFAGLNSPSMTQTQGAPSEAPAQPAEASPTVAGSGPAEPVYVEDSLAAEPIAEPSAFEMSDLGGRELDDSGEPIYDLKEFGAVEL